MNPEFRSTGASFGARISPLTGSPRLAVNPPNAILNYLYAVLESESRLAAAALGLDPGIGVLHVDTPYRDSLACDLMEAVRPQVDGYLIDWLTREPLKREWFFEQRDGNCRLMGSFAAQAFRDRTNVGSCGRPLCGVGRANTEDTCTQACQQRSNRTDASNPATQKRGQRKRVRSKFANCTAPSEDLCRLRCVPEKRQVLRCLCHGGVSGEPHCVWASRTSYGTVRGSPKGPRGNPKDTCLRASGLDRFRKSNHSG